MIATVIARLEFLCNTVPALLQQIDENEFSTRPFPDKWSKKEIIGHLIDSATNNHHRIVRGQFENRPKITYDNYVWNRGNHYQSIPGAKIIYFWTAYNRHLLEIIKRIPDEKMTNQVETGEKGKKNFMTISLVIEDYLEHMEYHLRQVVNF